MQSSELRYRGSLIIENKKKLDITGVEKDRERIIKVEPYNCGLKTCTFKTKDDGFIIIVLNTQLTKSNCVFKTMKDEFIFTQLNEVYCTIGRLVNEKIINITLEEQQRWESAGFLVADMVPKSTLLNYLIG